MHTPNLGRLIVRSGCSYALFLTIASLCNNFSACLSNLLLHSSWLLCKLVDAPYLKTAPPLIWPSKVCCELWPGPPRGVIGSCRWKPEPRPTTDESPRAEAWSWKCGEIEECAAKLVFAPTFSGCNCRLFGYSWRPAPKLSIEGLAAVIFDLRD